MGRLWLLGLVALAACDDVFGLDAPIDAPAEAPPDAPPACFADDFEAGTLGADWAVFSAAQVTLEDGELVIALQPDAGMAYAGIYTVSGSRVGQSAEIEILEVPAAFPQAQLYLEWGNNSGDYYSMFVEANELIMEVNTDQDERRTRSWDATMHRFWRIHHDPVAKQIVMSTRPPAGTWTEHERFETSLPVDNLSIEVGAGTSGSVTNPGRARVDNFVLRCP